jgi:phosphate transport system substrate-binding protein
MTNISRTIHESRTHTMLAQSIFAALFGFAIAVFGAIPAQAQEQAQGIITLRDRLHIVSSSSSNAVTEALVGAFVSRYAEVRPPRVEIVGSIAALSRFCVGVGMNTPDIAISSRRIARAQLSECQSNGVSDVVELQIGQGAVVIATRRGDSITNLSTFQIYSALAAEVAQGRGFSTNTHDTWSQVGDGLPETQIRAILPNYLSGTRGLFDDFIMEGGCRDVPAVRQIFLAALRVPKCTTVRADRRVRELAITEGPSALLDSPFGTIAAVSYAQLLESGGNLLPVALNGVLPTAATIANHEYELTRTIYLYAKRQHARSMQGVGVVRGVREFGLEAVSEAIGGPGGQLSSLGIVPFPAAQRATQRGIADRLTLISR